MHHDEDLSTPSVEVHDIQMYGSIAIKGSVSPFSGTRDFDTMASGDGNMEGREGRALELRSLYRIPMGLCQ